MDLVFLPLEPAEEAADARVLLRILGAFDDEVLLLVGQVLPRHVEKHLRLLRRALQLRELRAVVRLGPRLDRALLDRLLRIRHDEIHVELDDVAEAVAGRAGAERVVEREQPRLRILVRDAAGAALEALGEQCMELRAGLRRLATGTAQAAPPPSRYAVSIESVSRWRRSSPLSCTRSTTTCSIGRPRSAAGSMSSNATARPSTSRRAKPLRRRLAIGAGDGAAAAIGRASRRGVAARRARGIGRRGSRRSPRRSARRLPAPSPLDADTSTTGRSKPISRRVPCGSVAELPRHDLGRLAHDFLAAVAAEGAPDAREQQPHVVVDLGRRADGRARIADAVLLADGDRRARCRRCDRRPASPSARGTAARRPTATRRSAAALRRRSCRRRATTFPIR